MSTIVVSRNRNQEEERRRRLQRQTRSRETKILARYKHDIYKQITTTDVGTLKEMWAKYHGKYQIWCADQPPEKDNESGLVSGYRIDTQDYESMMANYGTHKAWIDPIYKDELGRPVILVWNAR